MTKKSIQHWTAGIALVALVAAGAVVAVGGDAAEAQGATTSRGRRLEGTWLVQVTIRDCASGAAVRTFPSLVTFAQGETVTETTTGFSPAQRSPGHGYWRHTGGQTYSAVSSAFLFSPEGAWTATQTIRQEIEIGDDPDEFTSTASIEFAAPNGTVVNTGCATAVGRRLGVPN